jgi:hypothetical protein
MWKSFDRSPKRVIEASILGLGFMLVAYAPAWGAGGDGGCCTLEGGGCKTTRESDCPFTTDKRWDGCLVCFENKCVPGDTAWLCIKDDKTQGACETDEVCPKKNGAGSVCTRYDYFCNGGANSGHPCRQGGADCPNGRCEIKAASAKLADNVTGIKNLNGLAAADAGCPCEFCDADPPTCILFASHPGPPAQIEIKVQDTGRGLLGVETTVASNASVDVPSFVIGTQDEVIVTATKIDPAMSSRVELQVSDLAGNLTVCDPILTEVVRATGKPVSQTHLGLRETEDTITIDNGNPGIKNLDVIVNGKKFKLTGLRSRQTRLIDVSSAMQPGSGNSFTLISYGEPGGSATIFIWDGGD